MPVIFLYKYSLRIYIGLSHQQIGLELVKQQQTLQALHEKVQQEAQQQAAVQALLARNVINKSQTPIAPIDGGVLESLLPTNDDENKQKPNEKNGNKNDTKTGNETNSKSAPNNNEKQGENNDKPKSLPQIPPTPHPPLQLQTSINSVVTGAVAASIMTSALNTNINANIADTNIKQQAPNIGFNNNNINVNLAVNNNNNTNGTNNNQMYYSHHQPQQIP